MTLYTKQEEEFLKETYDPDNESSIELCMDGVNKSKRSVIGKLSKMGIYQKKPYKTKTGEDPMTKKEMVEEICSVLGYEYFQLEGLEKTPKRGLKLLYNRILEDYS